MPNSPRPSAKHPVPPSITGLRPSRSEREPQSKTPAMKPPKFAGNSRPSVAGPSPNEAPMNGNRTPSDPR